MISYRISRETLISAVKDGSPLCAERTEAESPEDTDNTTALLTMILRCRERHTPAQPKQTA